MQWKRLAVRVALFACFGLLIEVFFTAGFSLFKDNWNMHGHSSPWMLIVYGLLGVFIRPVSARLKKRRIPFLARALVYMLLIFLVEYLYDTLFRALGLRIWDYGDYALNLHGHITLLYAPFWLFLGLWLEYLHAKLDACAAVLAIGYDADEILVRRNEVFSGKDSQSQP
ncbi:MAG TPA: hypothetical protein ENN29_12420 [Candidatus Hydrogenedentes bacterium]|nr:hypothetical protein [Candidatus Hydrogenedentota bacterium]